MPEFYFEFWNVLQPPAASSPVWRPIKRSLPFMNSCNYAAENLLLERAVLAEVRTWAELVQRHKEKKFVIARFVNSGLSQQLWKLLMKFPFFSIISTPTLRSSYPPCFDNS